MTDEEATQALREAFAELAEAEEVYKAAGVAESRASTRLNAAHDAVKQCKAKLFTSLGAT